MKIAITGGNGDMGSNLIPYLLERGHEVISMDLRLPENLWGRQSKHIVVDVNDYGQVVGGFAGADAVVHLAAHRSPLHHPAHQVYQENTVGSYNILAAAAALGIKKVCMASSINAIGGVYSRSPKYDYFPVDEAHPTYSEDPYSLSKWVMEMQGNDFARRYEDMTIGSLRFHWLLDSRERALELTKVMSPAAVKHLWAYTCFADASRAILAVLQAAYKGHEAFYIVAPRTAVAAESITIAQAHYPDVPFKHEMPDHTGFFDCSKAERLLGWRHEE